MGSFRQASIPEWTHPCSSLHFAGIADLNSLKNAVTAAQKISPICFFAPPAVQKLQIIDVFTVTLKQIIEVFAVTLKQIVGVFAVTLKQIIYLCSVNIKIYYNVSKGIISIFKRNLLFEPAHFQRERRKLLKNVATI